MMRTIVLIAISILVVLSSGCHSTRIAHRIYDHVDDCSDFKAELECLYPPELDISRAGMCDWCASSANRTFCKRRCNGTSCCVPPVYYPSKFTTPYRQRQTEAAMATSPGDVPSDFGSQVVPETTPILPPSPEN